MLNTETLERIYPLAQLLDARSIALLPAAQTPLASLVTATRAGANFNTTVTVNGAQEFEPSLSDIAYMANGDGSEQTLHDQAVDEVVLTFADAVRAQIRTIKTVVGPAVQELAEKTAEQIASLKTSSLIGMEIVVFNPPKLLNNAALEKDVRRMENVAYGTPLLRLNLAPLSGSDVIKLLETGTGSIDGDVAAWAATKGETFFNKVWDECFGAYQIPLNETRVRTLRDYLDHPTDGPDFSIAIYLLANRLWDNPPEQTNMPLPAYQDVMVSFRDQAALSVIRYMEQVAEEKKIGALVRSVQDRTTVVNGEVYRTWLDMGGSNEILFGNMVSTVRYSLVRDFEEFGGELNKKWHQYEMTVKLAESAHRFDRTKTALTTVFRQQLAQAGEDEIVSEDVRQRIFDLFVEELKQVTEPELDDLYLLSLQLLCRSRFIKTDAYSFLSSFNRIKKETPSATDEEIAAMAAIKYVAQFMASQIQVMQR